MVSAASTARGRATRQRIVTAAAELMLANGVAATSVDDVLCRSQASKSQLYHYFTDRQDLVLAVTQHACGRVLAAQQRLAGIADWDDLAVCFDRIVATRSNRVISAGRPPCPLCEEPLDPEGHICARANGYKRSALLGPDDDSEE